MKANYRNRIDVKTQERVEQAVAEEYERVKQEHEKKFNDRFSFLYMLATAIYAQEALGYGPKRRAEMVTGIVNKANEISDFLSGNKVTDADDKTERFDVEYNLDVLRRLSKEYGIRFDEEIFEDFE